MSQQKLHSLDLEILKQPDDATCGPTCLHAVYRYFGEDAELEDVIREVPRLSGGGTLAVNLANHALRRGYQALIYTYNLAVFDPSWFQSDRIDLSERLEAQTRVKRDPKLLAATDAYLQFLALGGTLEMEVLTPSLLRRWLERDRPVLTGLSATFLYDCTREFGDEVLQEDDLLGESTGHFVVLSGWDSEQRAVRVADPYEKRPSFDGHVYWAPVDRVINAVLLGVLTYDANLLVLQPPERAR